ncbi:MAG TPA: hypothetical protein VLG47_04775 [Candidatus Saccharimonadales bacterium]|nr:hypothetical protein [Candidatus Saccharimonadales bacterium]
MSEFADLSYATHLDRLQLAMGRVLAERQHVNIATIGEFPDGTWRPRVSESWAAWTKFAGIHLDGKNYLGFLCDSRRGKIQNILHPPEVNRGVAYVAGVLAVTQTADPVWSLEYAGEARLVQPEEELYSAIVENWVRRKRFDKETLDGYTHASGAAVGAHIVAAVEVTGLSYMNGITTQYPRYIRWADPFCQVKETADGLHESCRTPVDYQHLGFLNMPTEDIFAYAPHGARNVVV